MTYKITLGALIVGCSLLFFASLSLADDASDTEGRIDAIVARMTLQEKIGQMSQRGFPRELTDKIKAEIRAGRWGSFYGGTTPQMRAEIQRLATQESRLKIPMIFGADLIHGYHTTLPIPVAESCSWDPELVREGARLCGAEGSREGIDWTFSPMLDIARDPRWGRIAEGFGEDPQLCGDFAEAAVRGLQGDSLSRLDSIAACAKHYVGYGATEGGRDYNTTWIPEPLLRNVYLRPFAAALRAGVASYMSAFNDLNGIPASGNVFTLRQILRDEWRFDGIVVSDFDAVHELVTHGYAADDREAARKAIVAGVDMEMVSTCYFDHVKSLIDSGQLDDKLVDDCVRNILRVKFRLGLFGERGSRVPEERAAPAPESLAIARRLAAESIVLLKNENGVLPLSRTLGKIAVIGPLADAPKDQLGAWAADRSGPSVTPLAALRQEFGTERIDYVPGLKDSGDEHRDHFAEARKAAQDADVVLLFLGEGEDMSGEASARAYLDLPGAQEALADEVLKAGKPVVAILMAGRPLTFHALAQKVAGVLWAWHGGSEAGPAIVRTLFGDNCPSGKLTVTFPRTVGQIPIYYDHFNTGRPAQETGPYANEHFVSKYIDERFTPEYPFGFGLSYTTFKYSAPRASGGRLTIASEMTFSSEITNTGTVPGVEIAQFYTRQLAGSLTRPVRELKQYQRVALKPGETKTVTFVLKGRDLAYFGPAGTSIVEPGSFLAWISPDSASGTAIDFELTP